MGSALGRRPARAALRSRTNPRPGSAPCGLPPPRRNLVRSHASKSGNMLNVRIGGTDMPGTPVGTASEGNAVAAIRPDDLKASPDGPLSVTVESAQYHGRDFYCSGRTGDGIELYFCSERRVAKGDSINLTVDPSCVLVYAEDVP